MLGLKVVESLDEAIAHIAAHSTAHSDGILTRTDEHAQRFIAEVDSAAVYVNASTRFTDGSHNSDWARKSPSPRSACTPAVRWGCAN